MKKFFTEFKEFVLRGNVLNLAVGVIIGAAFQDVVGSLTANILSPIIGLFVGKDFNKWSVDILGVSILYGAFITSVINFLIMAFVVFLIVKAVNNLMSASKKGSKAEAADAPGAVAPEIAEASGAVAAESEAAAEAVVPEAPSSRLCPFCFTEINAKATRCPACTSALTE